MFDNGMSASLTYKRFYVKDRLNDSIYRSNSEFTYFGKAIEVYITNLEKKRKSFLN